MSLVQWLVEQTGVSVPVGDAGSCLLVGRAASGGVSWGVCELSMILGSLSANAWGVFLSC